MDLEINDALAMEICRDTSINSWDGWCSSPACNREDQELMQKLPDSSKSNAVEQHKICFTQFKSEKFATLLLLQDSFGKKLMDRIRPTQPRSCTVLFVRLYHGVSTQLRFLPC
ncbi:hypothetical protein IGI04_034532 [Brassica rapa subsp. trilocularis]|uniref:Uncharacterized protein n=1 Tax=Brassica rapa subsp. trilocularis TaxID=1813537 RepID=A0ABQ7L920_BRACM|nr:hypothetical protein IGI04_034532 [Brassica rapa subsp. trilocularis]